MQENNNKPISHSKTLAIVLISVAIFALVIGGVVAAATLTAKTVPGSGKITVPTSPAPPTTTTTTSTTTTTASGVPAEPSYTLSSDVNGTNLLTATGNIDFSCNATNYEGGFTQVVTIYIENTGTNGTGSYLGMLATINNLPITFTSDYTAQYAFSTSITYGAPAVIDSEVAGTSPTFTALPTGEAEAITITLSGVVTPNTSDTTQLLETLPAFSFTFSPS